MKGEKIAPSDCDVWLSVDSVFVMQMYDSFERILFWEEKSIIFVTPANKPDYIRQYQNQARNWITGRSRGKVTVLLMHVTADRDARKIHVKRPELSSGNGTATGNTKIYD